MKKVKEIMTTNVQSCHTSTNLAEVTRLMWQYDCGVLPVLDQNNIVIAVITDRDISIALGTKNRLATEVTVGEVISQQLYACTLEDSIKNVLEIMRARQVRRLPVLTAEKKLAGIISLNDIALNVEESAKPGADISEKDVASTLKAICKHRKDRSMAVSKQSN